MSEVSSTLPFWFGSRNPAEDDFRRARGASDRAVGQGVPGGDLDGVMATQWTRHEDKLGDFGKLRLLGFGVRNATLTLRVVFSGRKVTLNCDETIFALRQKVRTCGNDARRQG